MRTLIPFETRMPSLFDDFRREVDDLMHRFFEREGDGRETTRWFAPEANLCETETAYEVTLDLPGVKPEDFNVEFKHGELWITGERKHEEEQEEEKEGRTWHRVERHFGEFRKMFRLGEDADPDRIDAEYHDGVLRVTVPKTEISKPKKITVKS
ncbi:MAG: Hsp20/alpha crystallin family protein [Planctomycetales bacterium]